MRTLTTLFCATALICAGTFAQDKSTASKQSKEVTQDTKTVTNGKTKKMSADTVYGKVESYDASKSLKVTVPGKISSTKSYSLDNKDWTYNVASNLKAGDWVRVREKKDSSGHRTLTVHHSKMHGAHVKATS